MKKVWELPLFLVLQIKSHFPNCSKNWLNGICNDMIQFKQDLKIEAEQTKNKYDEQLELIKGIEKWEKDYYGK